MGRMGRRPPLESFFGRSVSLVFMGRVGHCASWVACPIVGVCAGLGLGFIRGVGPCVSGISHKMVDPVRVWGL